MEESSSPSPRINSRNRWWKKCVSTLRARNAGARGASPPSPSIVDELYNSGVTAWYEYLDEIGDSSALVKAAEEYSKALDLAPQGHPLRNVILLALIFALLEQDNDQQALEKIEAHFLEIEGWNELERVYARAIASKLGAAYQNFDPGRSLLHHIKARGYSDAAEDQVVSDLRIVALCRLGSETHIEHAMKTVDGAKSICPSDQPYLLSSILMTKFMLHQDKFRRSGSWEDLDKAIAEGEAALPLKMPLIRRITFLIDVAQCICVLQSSEFGFEKPQERMRDAIGYARQAVELANGDERLGVHLNIVLAEALSSRFANPTATELDEAITLYRKAKIHEEDLEILAGLAGAIFFRCEIGGEVAETETTLESAVALYETVLGASEDNDWNSRVANNLACIYLGRAQHTRDVADYEKARQNYLRAAGLCVNSDDKGYYEEQAEAIKNSIATLLEGIARDAEVEAERTHKSIRVLQKEARNPSSKSKVSTPLLAVISVIVCFFILFLFNGKPDND
ncbi:hypothetical protein H1R20_g11683, partial [Candolleomyces eurysporus]